MSNLLSRRDYEGVVRRLHSAGRSPAIRNTLGVCLLRLGRTEEALSVFRQFVLSSNGVLERSEISSVCKRNFATALLLNGLVGGALDALNQSGEPDHPRTIGLRNCLRDWERSLSWWRWLDWKINRIVAKDCHVPLTFEPGEFEFEVSLSDDARVFNESHALPAGR
ncbi:tetratricopeptide repeat protein [Rhodopirellula sp. P2]|uniref:tetratricopeptide repeat protein n=1 Tax=Rhodopirellula sp. P2 TaxID=2127060 RepID=UPI0023687F1E|nr:tetratricopeptide repeat protein [Rhodopirellula sp. P2]WDQ14610.1 tetratricopeptide repeat protein [Rhodopirellula sp. P2]